MALTRAQLLAGNQSQGFTLPGQVQGVSQGTGVIIAPNGQISVDASTVTGLMKLNNAAAYNSYVWPGADGAANEFLQTDGAGNLDWASPQGFAVVTVQPQPAPSPQDIGELWFDCTTGTLNVWQGCVGTPSPNWFNVAQPGLPVLVGNTSAVPVFTGGSGTQADPYDCTVTTTGSGTTVFIVNTVTITGLAPNQFVPIVDLNAVTNGGRFHFSNNYADATGTLVFQTTFDDAPASPSGTSYTASIRVGYATVYIDAIVNVVSALTTTAGTITGTPAVGSTLTYTTGVASGGVGPYTYSWVWKKASDNSVLQTDGSTYVVIGGLVGDNVYIDLTATDSASNTATATTANYPTPPNTIQPTGITGAVAPTTIPGTANFTWADAAGNLTATGCIEFSVNGGPFTQTSTAVVPTDTITTQWVNVASSGLCGDAPDGTTITGTLTDGTLTNTFTLTIDKVPNAFTFSPATETTTPNTVTTSNPSFTVAGINAPAYIWGTFTTSGSTPEYSVDAGGTWTALPTTPGTTTVDNGQTVIIRFTTGATTGSEVYTLNVGASLTAKQSGTFTVTVATNPFPNSSFTPSGAPNASPASVNTGTLFGTGSCASWADGSTSLTSTGGIQFQVNGGGYGTGPTAVAAGNTVDVIWDPAAISAAADGATLTGTLTNGVYTNTYTITVSRAVTGLSFADTTGIALSTATTSNIITPAGFNVPVSLTYAGTGTNPLTSIGVSVQGGAFNASPQTVNPGQTLQIQGTTGATNATAYGVSLSMGSGPAATDTWTATTVTTLPEIATPSIQTPANGATGVGTASGVTITASAYTPLNGAGAVQTSSLWEVYKDSYPLTSTNAITATATNNASWTSRTDTTNWGTTYDGTILFDTFTNKWVMATAQKLYASTTGPTGTYTLVGNMPDRPADNSVVTNGSGTYVSAGSVGTSTAKRPFVCYSTNGGTTWSSVNTSGWGGSTVAWGFTNVAYGNGTFVAVGSTANPGSTTQVWTSTNGSSWTQRTNALTSNASRVSFANGKFFMAAGSGLLYYSSDGITWTLCTTPGSSNTQFTNVAYGGGVYTVINNSKPYASSDGITWTAGATGQFGKNPLWIAYGGGLFYAVAEDGTCPNRGNEGYYSVDGLNWVKPTSSKGGFSVAYANGAFASLTAGCSSGTIYSTAAPAGTTTLTIAGCQTDGFLVGDTVSSLPAAAGPATITAVSDTAVTVAPSSTAWAIGQQITRPASSYSAVTGSPFTVSASPFTSLSIAKPPLVANTKYWARVQYATTNASVATSSYSAWSGFTTGTLIPAIGSLYGGGYFGGQINVSGTIYNLIVAPVEGNTTGPVTGGALKGQTGGTTPTSSIAYKTANTADTPSATVQNVAYGGNTTDLFKASAAHPVFSSFINGATGPNAGAFNLTTGGGGGGTGIGGYNDWYLPALNELEILYRNLKPSTDSNNTSFGANANAVPTATSNYTATNPGQTTVALFQTGGGQEFSLPNPAYWTSTEVSGTTTAAYRMNFNTGNWNTPGKSTLNAARAIRRVVA